MNKDLLKTTRFLNLYAFFSAMMFWFGIEQFFLNEFGNGTYARGASTTVFMLSYAIINIPAGALSDIWGRLRSLRLGIVFQIVGVIILGTSTTLTQYLLGYMIFAGFWALEAGAKEAYLYDSLVDHKKGHLFQKHLGRLHAYLLIGAATGNALSGFVADSFGLRSSYLLSLVASVLSLVVLSFMREPKHHRQVGKKVVHQIGDLYKLIKKNLTVRLLVLAGICIFLTAVIVGEFAQVVILEFTDSPKVLGFLWMAVALIMALGRWFSHKISYPRILVMISTLSIGVYFALSGNYFGLLVFLMLIGLLETIININDSNIQDSTPSKLRASVFSVTSTVSGLLVAPLALFLGSTAEGSIARPITLTVAPLLLLSLYLLHRASGHIDTRRD